MQDATGGSTPSPQPPATSAAAPPSPDPIREKEDAALRAKLIELKTVKADGKRPLDKAHGRWIGDFLTEDAETGLKPAEEKLLLTAVRGEWCEVGSERPDTEPQPSDPIRQVRGPFLRFLALGGDETLKVHEAGLQLIGGVITGDFDLEATREVSALWLHECVFLSAPVLRHARISSVSLSGSITPGLEAAGVYCQGNLDLCSNFKSSRQVQLTGATIKGRLDCELAEISASSDADESALCCDAAEISGDVFLGEDSHFVGEVRFHSAKIGGLFDCRNSKFERSSYPQYRNTLILDGADIARDVLLGCKVRDGSEARFYSHGVVKLVGTKIGGDLDCYGGHFTNAIQCPDSELDVRVADCFVADGATVAASFWLGPGTGDRHLTTKFDGSVSLQGTHVKTLIDDERSWPGVNFSSPVLSAEGRPLTCDLALDGFTYERFAGQTRPSARTRVRWLERQPLKHRTTEFRPQPYEQLAKVLRAMGHEHHARLVAKARRSAELKARIGRYRRNNQFGILGVQLERFFLGALAGYGYAFKRILVMFAALWIAGWYVYSAAGAQGLMAPASPAIFKDVNLNEKCRNGWTKCPELPKEHTPFSPAALSLDLILPVVSLGVDKDWVPIDRAAAHGSDRGKDEFILTFGHVSLPFSSSFVTYFYWAQIIGGWLVSALLLTVLSGVIKKD